LSNPDADMNLSIFSQKGFCGPAERWAFEMTEPIQQA
jgi:hypothetical protein